MAAPSAGGAGRPCTTPLRGSAQRCSWARRGGLGPRGRQPCSRPGTLASLSEASTAASHRGRHRGAQHGWWGSQDWGHVGSDCAQKAMQLPAAGSHSPWAKVLTGRASWKVVSVLLPRVLPPRGAFVGDRREQEAAMRLIELSPASLKVACSQRLCSRSPPATVSYFKQSA